MARIQVAISTPMCCSMDNGGDDCIAVWDVSTGNMLSTYRSNGQKSASSMIPRHCIDRIGYQYVLNGYQNSPLLNVWSLDGKDRLHLKLILPGNVGALCVTPDGHYCLTAIDTRLYIWQLASGYLLAQLDGHYQSIGVIKVTGDQSYFITGGDDGVILIWNFAKVIVPDSRPTFSVIDGHSDRLKPEQTITNSSTAIIDIHVGSVGRFVVCSEQSCQVKMYQLPTGIHLASISFPQSIVSVVMDRMERALFVGSITGQVYEVLFSQIWQPKQKSDCGVQHFDLSTMINEEESSNQRNKQVMIGHTGAVNAMAITVDGQALLTGSQDRTIRLWHIDSHQCMRTVQCKGPISNLMVVPSMAGLFLFDSLQSCNYSLNSTLDSGNQMSDPSLSNNVSPSSRKSRKQRNKSMHSPLFNSIYSRPQSIEQTLRTLPNPPKPISQVFQRDLFRLRFNPISLTRSRASHSQQQQQIEPTDDSGLLNAFEHGGCLWIRNDQTSAHDFWPRCWSNFMKPDLAADYFNQQMLFEKHHNSDHRRKMATNGARSMVPDTGPLMMMTNDDDDDEDEAKQSTISQLRQANHQLYQLAIEAIFDDDKSMASIAAQSNENVGITTTNDNGPVECIELDE
ncbi:WD repeat-containing protein 18 [Dermatophagoides pteronyssinus]|uniref:WD repeat-containing protein 18 n=1 Tax=Dermatophagoides pteronyssinus TaxID=6956 RepID=UPI003F67C7B9